METYFNNLSPKSASKEKLVEDFQEVVKDAEELLREAGDKLPQKTREKLQGKIERVKATYEAFQEKAVAGAKSTDKLIQAHPYESLGVAFGVGLLIGLLINKD